MNSKYIIFLPLILLCGLTIMNYSKTEDQSINDIAHNFSVNTYMHSYFERNNDGTFSESDDPLYPHVVNEKKYFFNRSFKSSETALIVMDPWYKNGSSFLDAHFSEVITSSLIPLIKKATALGIKVIFLTNKSDNGGIVYSKLHPSLNQFLNKGSSKIIYHQDYSEKDFSRYLDSSNTKNLIYSGFASNMCLIGRPLGIISMHNQGYKVYFVPEASAAIEYQKTWEKGHIHTYITKVISQWLAEIIPIDEFLNVKTIN
jgi:nicotinamidase-related amidase